MNTIAMIAAVATLAFPKDAAPEGCAPMKGLVLWPDNGKMASLASATSLEFSYFLPCDVATGLDGSGKTVYDWSRLDALLDAMASRRHQAVLRFRYAYPGEKLGGVKGATAVPAFIKERADYHETYAANPGGDGPTWYPDWSCAALEDFTLDFHRAFAERYDADPRVAFLEAGFGHWAEYHTYGTKTKPGVNFPSIEFQKKFFRQMAETMQLTPWMVSIDAAARDDGYSPARELAAEGLEFGLFDDSFMCEEHEISSGDGDNELNWKSFGADRWKTSPCGGEISYYSDSDQKNFLRPAGIYGITWAQAAAKYHMAFVIANDSVEGRYATKERFLKAQDECGYKLEVKSAVEKNGGLEVEIANTGVAAFYHPASVSFAGRTASGTLQGILPGETRTFFLRGARDGATLEIVSPKFLGWQAPAPKQHGLVLTLTSAGPQRGR